MDLKEFYTSINGDYEGVVSRLRSEKMVRKFVLKFLNDSSYDNLVKSLEENNYEEAFRASHTIKGICQNLSLDRLYESSNNLADLLRNKEDYSADLEPVLEKVKEDYQVTIDCIKQLD